MSTNTQRTLKYLRDLDLTSEVVERWIRNPKHPAGGVRRDLFNFIDIITMSHQGIIAVQSCGQAFSEHNKMILESDLAHEWLCAGADLWLIGWRKLKVKRGGKAMRWTPRVRIYSVDDFKVKEHAT